MTTIIGDDDSYDKINKYWRKLWHNTDGKVHRDGDLPAVIFTDGSVYYYNDGKLHHEGDFPAVIHADGTVEYWVNGKKQK